MPHTGETSRGVARTARRLPLLAVGLLSMACGLWLGLLRLGWNLPLPWPDQLIAHGPLMVCGFLGTLISLERAVALGARWGYAAPVLTAAGALALDLGPAGAPGALLITAGSVVMLAMFVVVWRRQPALFILTMALGALAWVVGNALWLGGASIFRLVFWWMAFLVLTIAGERLELNRVLRPTPAVRAWFVAGIVLMLAGVVVERWRPEPGVRVIGAGLLVLAVWLMRHDVARRTVRQRGLTRFMAVCLLAGYVWLGAGGILALALAPAMPGTLYDATLHAVFLGFVMSMVFAHAPVIFPPCSASRWGTVRRSTCTPPCCTARSCFVSPAISWTASDAGGRGAGSSTPWRCCCSWSTPAGRSRADGSRRGRHRSSVDAAGRQGRRTLA